MGNIVTPQQGFLPLPAQSAGLMSAYPWWLNAALAIWALLALLCCWLLLSLLLLRYCLKRWRHRKYARGLKSQAYRTEMRGRGGGQKSQENYFATAPLPPIPAGYREDTFADGRPYAGAGARAGNQLIDLGLESYSEEEISNEASHHENLQKQISPMPVVTENVEHNITKNYIINEERNYLVKQEPIIENIAPIHNQEIQHLPAPNVSTIHMAAERITDNTNWEKTNALSNGDDPGRISNQRAASEIVASDPAVFRQNVEYRSQPSIFTHRPATPVQPRQQENRPIVIDDHKLGNYNEVTTEEEHGSTTSEMSGHDSESIYETIRVLAPKKQTLAELEDDDVYRTAGIDEVEFEVKDLIRLQRDKERTGDPYEDILQVSGGSRRRITPLSSSASSSSTLKNLMGKQIQPPLYEGEEKQEETVTETIQTQQIQTTFRQLGQGMDNSAFFIPLTSSATESNRQTNNNGTIFIPVSSSTIQAEEKPALNDKTRENVQL